MSANDSDPRKWVAVWIIAILLMVLFTALGWMPG